MKEPHRFTFGITKVTRIPCTALTRSHLHTREPVFLQRCFWGALKFLSSHNEQDVHASGSPKLSVRTSWFLADHDRTTLQVKICCWSWKCLTNQVRCQTRSSRNPHENQNQDEPPAKTGAESHMDATWCPLVGPRLKQQHGFLLQRGSQPPGGTRGTIWAQYYVLVYNVFQRNNQKTGFRNVENLLSGEERVWACGVGRAVLGSSDHGMNQSLNLFRCVEFGMIYWF